MLRVSQIFGPTIQGEGSAAGRHCLFLRMFDCNLQCNFCDTPYTWAYTSERAAKTRSGILHDKNDARLGLKNMNTDEVLKEIHALWDYMAKPTIVVVSGGEPMMQQAALCDTIKSLRSWNNEVHVETAGTIAPQYEFGQLVSQFNVSPKLASSGNRLEMRYKPAALRVLAESGKAWFKFVVCTDPDLARPVSRDTYIDEQFKEIDGIVQNCGIHPRRVMVMPEGSEAAENIYTAKCIVDRALARGYGLSFRTHILIWGDDDEK